MGSPINKIIVFTKELPIKKLLAITANVINNTGSNAIKKLNPVFGDSFITSLIAGCSGISIFIFLNNLPRNGPAIIDAGMAMINPNNNVLPISALKAFTSSNGPGCGGKKQCVVLREAAIGIAR